MRFLAFAVLAILTMSSPVIADTSCSETEVRLRGPWGQARFTVEIADEHQERQQGLMFRESLPSSAGMLFLFERPGKLSFWMRNTLIELDIIFIQPDGVVGYIHHRAQPLDESLVGGEPGMIAVLEINGGLAEQMGIGVGTEVLHPFFGTNAAWPCESD